jgi:N-acylneuraminate-9-phosphatase
VGCKPSEAVHVGDSLGSDIGGAINAGLAASIWINPQGTPAPEGKPQPTYVVRKLPPKNYKQVNCNAIP